MMQMSSNTVVVLEAVHKSLSWEASDLLCDDSITKYIFGDKEDPANLKPLLHSADIASGREPAAFEQLQPEDEHGKVGLVDVVCYLSQTAWDQPTCKFSGGQFKDVIHAKTWGDLLTIPDFGFYAASDAYFTLWIGQLHTKQMPAGWPVVHTGHRSRKTKRKIANDAISMQTRRVYRAPGGEDDAQEDELDYDDDDIEWGDPQIRTMRQGATQ